MSYPVYYAEENDTLPIFFDTFDGGTGASITMTGLAVTDIEIYKDGSVTQRASDAGYTLLDTDGIDFDGITGIHGFSIDLSDNTDAGFYAVGSWYHVVVSSVTVDSQTVSFIAAAFRIVSATRGMAGTALPDAAADAAGGLPISDAGGLDMDAILTDTNSLNDTKIPDTISLANINAEVDTALSDVNLDHVVGTAAPGNPPAGTYLDILADDGTATYDRTTDSLQAIRDRGDAGWTTGGAGSGLSALSTGTAQGGAASSITLTVGDSGTNDIYNGARILTTGGTGAGQARMITAYNGTSKVASVAPNWTTNPDATTTYEIQAADAAVGWWRGAQPNALVAGAVDADVSAIQAGAVDAAAIATGAVDADALATDAVNEIADQVWEEALADHSGTAGSVAEQLASVSATGIADQVWDEATASHVAAGSFGLLMGQIADTIWDETIEAGAPVNAQTARELMRLFAAALLGKTNNTGADWVARDLADTKNRIEATLTSDGFRSEVSTRDGS